MKTAYVGESKICRYEIPYGVTGIIKHTGLAYMVMVRCGIDTETYLDKDDFRNITDFNTPELVNLFGTATSDVAEMALGEISDTILKLQKEEKRRSRTFAGENAGRYACQQ